MLTAFIIAFAATLAAFAQHFIVKKEDDNRTFSLALAAVALAFAPQMPAAAFGVGMVIISLILQDRFRIGVLLGFGYLAMMLIEPKLVVPGALAVGAILSAVSGGISINWVRALVVGCTLSAATAIVFPANVHLTYCVALGAAATVMALLATQDQDSGDSFRYTLASVAFFGVATLAFIFAKATGIALAAVSALALMGAIGSSRQFATALPLLGICSFRAAKTVISGGFLTFDIGHHYALTGIFLGAMLPILYAHGTEKRVPKLLASIALALASVGAAVGVTQVLTLKGLLGVSLGSGLSGLAGRESELNASRILNMTAINSLVAVVGYSLVPADVDRDLRLKILTGIALGVTALGTLVLIGTKEEKSGAA